jgi:hypothetical protein
MFITVSSRATSSRSNQARTGGQHNPIKLSLADLEAVLAGPGSQLCSPS